MTDQTKKSQKDLILAHIEKYGSITALEAEQFYGGKARVVQCRMAA